MGVLGGRGRAGLPLALGVADVVVAPAARDELFGGGACLGGDAQRVGTHVGDQTHGAVACNVHAFVQCLGSAHRAGGREAKGTAGVLLQGGGDKGRRGLAAALAFFQLGDGVAFTIQRGHDGIGLLFVGDGQLFAVSGSGQAGRKAVFAVALGVQRGVDVPIFIGLEVFNFQLAVADQAHRHALHTAGGEAAADLAP